MSVLSCSRKYCKNVVCDRYSTTFGYICHSCFEKLVALGFHADIGVFMISEIEPQIQPEGSYKRFDEEFPFG